MNKEKETAYCPNCRKETVFELKQISIAKDTDCVGIAEAYFCSDCGLLKMDLKDE